MKMQLSIASGSLVLKPETEAEGFQPMALRARLIGGNVYATNTGTDGELMIPVVFDDREV